MAIDLAVLMYQVSQGDQRAFEVLYRDTSGRLYALALRIVRRRELADEVLQEAFVKVWHAAESYQPERGAVQHWLSTIVRRTAIDRLRKGACELVVEPMPDWESLADMQPGPAEQVIRDAETRRLSRCMDDLDEHQKHSIALAFFQGMTHRELAQHLDTPLGTVKAWVRRGLDRLRSCLRESAS